MNTPDHGDALTEFWGLTRSYRTERPKMMEYAQMCVELARQKVPCIRDDMPHFPLLKFIAAHGLDDYADALDMVFRAYVENGYIDPNETLDVGAAAPHHYKPMHRKLPLEAALRNGNLHAAELLIRYGARTDIKIDDMDMLDFVDERFGHHYAITPRPEERVKARIRLVDAMMRQAMSEHEPSDPQAPATRRRRAAL